MRRPLVAALVVCAISAAAALTVAPAARPMRTRRMPQCARMSFAAPGPFEDDAADDMTPFTPSFDADSDAVWDVEDEHPMDMAALASRIQTVREADAVQERLEALPCAWVLVFDADTEDEAVYSMELASDPDAHVVLAFEDRTEAEAYALALSSDPLEDGYDAVASVQGLDVEALVVTSRDADFKVGVVFGGDLLSGEVDSRSSSSSSMGGGSGLSASAPMITGGVPSGLGSLYPSSPPPSVSISITMVPDACFEGRTADDFLDPTEDPVWVLVHDEGTGDAQLFSMALNGTASVICFKDEEAADRCSTALRLKGSAQASAHALYLEDLLERMGDDDMEICLVDEVIETVIEDAAAEADGLPRIVATDEDDALLGQTGGSSASEVLTGAGENSIVPPNVREMLEGLWDGDSSAEAEGRADGPSAQDE